MGQRLLDIAKRHWLAGTVAAWALFAVVVCVMHRQRIATLALTDTDDNLRMAQVRDWMAGQGWFDLRQYRMLVPEGADIHWSRIVDLPIAGLIALFEPFVGGNRAEQWAATGAPLLALLVASIGVVVAARRLAGPLAWAPAMAALIFSPIVIGMFLPLRIDHHGWQLACLAWVMAGALDPERRRGGLVAGAATAISLGIGLEMLIPMALIGAGCVVGWFFRREEAARIGAYGLALALGVGLMFLLFASEANRLMRCDALTPVWLADMVLAGAAAFVLAWRNPADWRWRVGLAVLAGIVLATFHALAFPQCLTRFEGVSPEVTRLWLDRVNEARSVLEHKPRTIWNALFPVTVGLLGYGVAILLNRRDGEALRRTLILAAPALVTGGLMFWQLRAGPSAQLLAVPGAAALVVLLLPRTIASGRMLVRVVGTAAVAIVGIGALGGTAVHYFPEENDAASRDAATTAGPKRTGACKDRRVMGALDALPAGTVFTAIDLAPRLLVTTHHAAVTGPYHRNFEAIGDVIRTLESSSSRDAAAEATVRGYGSDYVMVCADKAPAGDTLEKRLRRGEAPDWLTEVNGEFGQIRLYRLR